MTYLAQSLILLSNPIINIPIPAPSALGDIVALNFNSNESATSNSGIQWQVVSGFGLPSGQWEDVIFCNAWQRYVAIRSNVSNDSVFMSVNGTQWEAIGLNSLSGNANKELAESANAVVSIIKNSSGSPTSTYNRSGTLAVANWSTGSLPKSIFQGCIAYGDGKFVIMSANSSSASNKNIGFYSSNGATGSWTEFNTPITTTGWIDVGYGEPAPGLAGGKQWVAIAANSFSNSSVVAYSNDAITWNESVLPDTKKYLALAYSPIHNRWVAMNQYGSNFCASDDGGQTWSNTTVGQYGTLGYTDIAYTEKGFVAIAKDSGANVTFSSDGLNWIQYNLAQTEFISANSQWSTITSQKVRVANVVNIVTNTEIASRRLDPVATPTKFNMFSLALPPRATFSDSAIPYEFIPFERPAGTFVTVEFWRYYANVSFDQAAIEFVDSSDTFATIEPNFGIRTSASTLGSSFPTPTANTWNHYVLVFSSDGIVRALNGSGSPNVPNSFFPSIINTANKLVFRNRVYSGRASGFIEDFRVSNGDIYNIYSTGGNYTVPTAALTATANTTLLIKATPKYPTTVLTYPDPVAIGAAYQGGYYAGQMSLNGSNTATHYLVVSPKSAEKLDVIQTTPSDVPGSLSQIDGKMNTDALFAVGGSPAATYVKGLSIGGYNDWYIPSIFELEIMYYYLKPQNVENWIFELSYPSGRNPYSVPRRAGVNDLYTRSVPAQTSVSIFQAGNSEAISSTSRASVMSSTQCPHPLATQRNATLGFYSNLFSQPYAGPIFLYAGGQFAGTFKSNNAIIRPVRRVPIV